MVTRRENIKRYIKIISEQLPKYIQAYSPKDQELLLEFLKPLQSFEEADYNRPSLSQKFRSARQVIINQDNYLNLPFSWFVETYFENAEIALQISTFHADQFYDYLLTILKGTKNNGVFHLLQEKTALDAMQWEQIQYKSAKLRVPLKSYQLQILKTIYLALSNQPLDVFRPNRLHTHLLSQHDIPRLTGELPKFFQLLNAKWSIWPEYSSFGLQTFFFKLWLSPNSSLHEIIDFKDSKNQILTTSIVYSIRKKENEFMGILILPEGSQERLTAYLNEQVSNSILKKYLVDPITENRWSYSISQYRTDKGWQELTKSAWKQRIRILSSHTHSRKRKNSPLTYLSPPKTNNWSFEKLKNPHKAIELICRPNEYKYSDLKTSNYTSQEFHLLGDLLKHNAILSDFYCFRLILEFSLDSYWIEAPNLSMYQLTRLLDILPYARIARTKTNNYIHTYLTPTIVQRITDDLEWPIYPLLPVHTSSKREKRMFDKQTMKWHLPSLLEN